MNIPYLFGSFVGGCLVIFLVSLLAGSMFFRDWRPDAKAAASVATAWFAVGGIAGFGMADGGPFFWLAWLLYAPSSLVVWLYRRWKLRSSWIDDTEIFT